MWGTEKKCEHEVSPYFTVRTAAPKETDLVLLEPEQGAAFQSGQSLEIMWAGLSSDTIDVLIRRDVIGSAALTLLSLGSPPS